MQFDLYSYITQMQNYLEAQDRRIAKLENSIRTLTQTMSELKNKAPVNVERIEYKFDQLKVETLEGTLNIGLNPNDLSNIDEFMVNNVPNPQPGPYVFPNKNQWIKDINETMHSYMNNHLQRLIEEAERQTGHSLNPSYHQFIRQDIEKQLPERIGIYIDSISPAERSQEGNATAKENIIEKIKADLAMAIHNFVLHSSNMGGNMDHGV